MMRKWLLSLTFALSAGVPLYSLAQSSTAPVMWDLSDLYPTAAAWDEALNRTRAAADKVISYKGTLGRSADAMFTTLDAISAANREAARLAIYASLKSDEDVR